MRWDTGYAIPLVCVCSVWASSMSAHSLNHWARFVVLITKHFVCCAPPNEQRSCAFFKLNMQTKQTIYFEEKRKKAKQKSETIFSSDGSASSSLILRCAFLIWNNDDVTCESFGVATRYFHFGFLLASCYLRWPEADRRHFWLFNTSVAPLLRCSERINFTQFSFFFHFSAAQIGWKWISCIKQQHYTIMKTEGVASTLNVGFRY